MLPFDNGVGGWQLVDQMEGIDSVRTGLDLTEKGFWGGKKDKPVCSSNRKEGYGQDSYHWYERKSGKIMHGIRGG